MSQDGMDAPARAVVIVGGGLSGLTAAVQLARLNVPSIVFDQATELGGRARTERRCGFHLNFGPHRLYRAGAAVRALAELDVHVPSAARGPNGGIAVRRGRKFTLPVGMCSLLTTGLLDARAKRGLARLMMSLEAVRTSDLERVSMEKWLRIQVLDADVVQLVRAFVRSATYCDDFDRLSASAAIDQLRLSVRDDVLYVHHGWSAMTESLVDAASRAGTLFVRGQRVTEVRIANEHADGVTLSDGSRVPAAAVILATDPQTAAHLMRGVFEPAPMPSPVRVAALDVALRTLPDARTVFAIGIDEPWCYSADSAIARVAPDEGAVVHLAKYLVAGASGSAADARQLERALDLLQPGWRDRVLHRRFLPTVTVSHALVSADTGGFAGRRAGFVPAVHNLFLAGDWIGPVGQLADASIASGVAAARRVARLIAGVPGAHRAS
jgi:phytoene dehydrogenase-like protein